MSYNRKTTVYLNPSVLDALGEAETPEELVAAWQEAVSTYTGASSGTRTKWRRYVKRRLGELQARTLVRPGR